MSERKNITECTVDDRQKSEEGIIWVYRNETNRNSIIFASFRPTFFTTKSTFYHDGVFWRACSKTFQVAAVFWWKQNLRSKFGAGWILLSCRFVVEILCHRFRRSGEYCWATCYIRSGPFFFYLGSRLQNFLRSTFDLEVQMKTPPSAEKPSRNS